MSKLVDTNAALTVAFSPNQGRLSEQRLLQIGGGEGYRALMTLLARQVYYLSDHTPEIITGLLGLLSPHRILVHTRPNEMRFPILRELASELRKMARPVRLALTTLSFGGSVAAVAHEDV